jgi:glycosyltransferase involved in cell wall biosynthesis
MAEPKSDRAMAGPGNNNALSGVPSEALKTSMTHLDAPDSLAGASFQIPNFKFEGPVGVVPRATFSRLPSDCGSLCSPVEPEPASGDAGSGYAVMTPKQSIVHVTWSLVAGGSEMYAFTIASNLDPVRYNSFICAIDQGGPLEPEVKAAGIPYCIMNRRPGIQLSLVWRLFDLFRRTGARVVHTHHFNQLFYSAIGAKLLGAKLIHTEHSVEYLKARRFRIALRLLSILCDSVIAIGEDGASVLRGQVGIPTRKVRIVRAGVNMEEAPVSKEQAREELGLHPEDKIAVIVARLYPEKNHILLLDAFIDVVRRAPSARLLIVGEGTEQSAIAAHVSKLGLDSAVTMMGVRRDVQRILAASDLFVLSSDREGLPIAVLEAMAMSRPVVATRVGDVPKVVAEGVTGRLVESRNPKALAEAIVDVLSSTGLSDQMGENAREAVRKNFSLAAMINEFESLYSSKYPIHPSFH